MNENNDSILDNKSIDPCFSNQHSLSEKDKSLITDYISTLSDLEETLIGISNFLKHSAYIEQQNNDSDKEQSPVYSVEYELPENSEEHQKNTSMILFLNSDQKILSLNLFKQKTRTIQLFHLISLTDIRQKLLWSLNTAKEIVSISQLVTHYCNVEISFVYPHLRSKIISNIIHPDDVDEKNMIERSDFFLYEYCKDLADFIQNDVFTQTENSITVLGKHDTTDLNGDKELKPENISLEERLDSLLEPLIKCDSMCIKMDFRNYLRKELLQMINDNNYMPIKPKKKFDIYRGHKSTFYKTMKVIKGNFKMKAGSFVTFLSNSLYITKKSIYNSFVIKPVESETISTNN